MGVKKGSKRAHLPINRSINVIKREIVRRGVREMWKGHILIFFNYFLCFGDKGEIRGSKKGQNVPLPINVSINVIKREIVRRGDGEIWRGYNLILFTYLLWF